MAYIPVRRKRRRDGLPWPLFALAALGLLVLAASRVVSLPDPGLVATGTGAPAPPPPTAYPTNTPLTVAAAVGTVAAPLATALPTVAPTVAATASAPSPAAALPTPRPLVTSTPVPAARGDVASGLPFGRPDAMAALVGRRARLSEVTVLDVVGDKTFWVGPSMVQSVLVYFDEDEALDDEVQVRPGQVVSLTGDVRAPPDREVMETEWELDPDTAEAVVGDRAYVYVGASRDFTVVREP